MTRAQCLHQASVILDEIGEKEIEEFFGEFVHDQVTEDLLRERLARWKAEQLRKMESVMIRMQYGEGNESVH